MSRSQNLFRLQQIDSNIDQANSRLEKIESLLSDNAKLRKLSAQATKAKNDLELVKKEQHQAEKRVKDQRIKIEQVESTLYSGSVRNPKELQDLQNEVAALKRFLDTLEERQLEAMIAVDDSDEQYQESQENFEEYRSQVKIIHNKLIRERDQIQNERKNTLEERLKSVSIIQPDDLAIYNRFRKQKAGVAVAKVEARACNACGSTLTAALNQAARSPSQVVFCDSCGRILYAT